MCIEMLVLAGGFGTRLKETIGSVPKTVAPINGTPLLKLQLDNWIKQGQRKFIFLLHYKAQSIIDILNQQSRSFGNDISIDWVVEDTPMGTGGSICNAIQKRALSKSILIINADTWLDTGIGKIRASKTPSMAVINALDTTRFGSVALDDRNYVSSFIEKNSTSKNTRGIINAGIYKLPTSLFSNMDAEAFSLEKRILPNLIKRRALHAVVLEGNFFDIGVPKDYYQFCEWHQKEKETSG